MKKLDAVKTLHAIHWLILMDKIKFLCHDYDLPKIHYKCRNRTVTYTLYYLEYFEPGFPFLDNGRVPNQKNDVLRFSIILIPLSKLNK